MTAKQLKFHQNISVYESYAGTESDIQLKLVEEAYAQKKIG